MRRPSSSISVLACMLLFASPTVAATGFVENCGQLDPRVLYYARTASMDIYLTSDALVLDLRNAACNQPAAHLPRGPEALTERPSPTTAAHRGFAVWIRFRNGSAAPRVEARDALPGRLNFFLGSDPSRYRSGVGSFREVIYHDAWSGADMRLRLAPDGLEYDAIRTGGGSGAASFTFTAVPAPASDGSGGWRLSTPLGVLEQIPTAGDAGTGLFRFHPDPVGSERERAPALGPQAVRDDPSRLLWSSYLGGIDLEWGTGVVLDPAGDPIVCGFTRSWNFPTTPGAYDRTYSGWDSDIFVSKLSASGGSLIWSTYLGGNSEDETYALALDHYGNVVTSGLTLSTDFPTTTDAYDRTANGHADIFVSKLDPSGSRLLYSTYVGGSNDDIPLDLAVDEANQIHVIGCTMSADLPTTPGAYDRQFGQGVYDAFVMALTASGTSLLFSTFLGGSGLDSGNGIAISAAGDVVVAGYTNSPDFPTTEGAYDRTPRGEWDAYISILDATGSTLLRSTLLGGAGNDVVQYLAVDADGNCLVSGQTNSRDFPVTPGGFDPTYHGGEDGYVAELDGTLHQLNWSTYVGGAGDDRVYAFVEDRSDNLVMAGMTSSPDFPMTPGALDSTYNGVADAWIAKLSASGSVLLWSSFLGGSDYDEGLGLTLAPDGNPIVVGMTKSTDFPVTSGAYDVTFNGFVDAFIAKLDVTPVAGAPSGPEPGVGLTLRVGGPNPSTGVISLGYFVPRSTAVFLSVLDPSGRTLESRTLGWIAGGAHSLTWPLRAQGHPPENGVYFVRLAAGGQARTQKVVIAR